MESVELSEVISTGDFGAGSRDVLSILWAITKGCNYRCSYCPYSKNEKFTLFSSEQELSTAVDTIVRLGRPRYQITLYGGEPTYHPHFHHLVRTIAASRAPIELRMFTNGSRSPDFFEQMAEASGATRFGVIFSLHLEHARFDNFKRAVEVTARAGMSVGINFMFLAALRTRARAYFDELCELRQRVPFFFEMSLPYTTDGWMGQDCTPADLQWRDETRRALEELPMPAQLSSPFYTRIMSDITIERAGVQKRLAREESLQLLAKPQMPSYEGFYCCSGANVFFIEEDGSARGGVCSSSGVLGNVFRDSAETLVNNIAAVRCRLQACSSIENIPLPKFRDEAEASACVAEIKLRSTEYMQRAAAMY